MPAPTSSGRVMSAWLKAVRPALKLMNVFTTATEASEIAVAAGIPSSRTRPDDCLVNSPCAAGTLPDIEVLAIDSPPLTWFLWKVPLEGSRTISEGLHAVKENLGDRHPPPLGRGALDCLADGLDGSTLAEIGLPGACRPLLEQVPEVVDEAGAVAHALADRPPAARVWMTLLLGPDPAHAVERGLVGALAVEQLVEARVLERQGPRVAVDLDHEIAGPAHRRASHLENAAGARLEPQQGRRGVVDAHVDAAARGVGPPAHEGLRLGGHLRHVAHHPQRHVD